jgi:hypothetical protein
VLARISEAGPIAIRTLACPCYVVTFGSPEIDIVERDVVAGDIVVALEADGWTTVV